MSTTKAMRARTTSPLQRILILVVVMAADVLDLLDSTITNIAAPTIAKGLGGGQQLIQWAGAGYTLALGVLLVFGGRLGDRYGRRRMFLIGLIGFTLASTACGLAVDPTMFIVTRLAQGAFGALLIPQGFGILLASYPREEVSKAFSAFGPVMGISAIGGPILAGFILQLDLFGLSWRPMFLINLVIGVIALIIALLVVPKDTGERSTALDGLGAGLLGLTMLGLLGGLIEGSANGWGVWPFTLIALGAIGFAAFVWRQRTATAPIIEPSLLKNRGFTSGLIIGLLYFSAIAGLLYIVSLFLQGGLHYSALNTSLSLTPIAVGLMVSSIIGGMLMARLGRALVFIGFVLTIAGTAWIWLLVQISGVDLGPWALVAPLALIGMGMGACFGTIFNFALGNVDPKEIGSASGALNAVQQISNAAGSAAITSVFFAFGGATSLDGMLTGLALVGILTLVCCLLVGLLPRTAQPQEP